jgi:uncharacterized protein YpmS
MTSARRAEAVRKAESVKQQVKAVAKDMREGRRRDFEITIGEDEINELLQEDPEIQKTIARLDVRDPYASIGEDAISLTCVRSVGGVDVTPTITLAPTVSSSGNVSVSVESAQLGRLNLPDRLTRKFADRVAAEISQKINKSGMRLKTLRIAQGQIVAEGSTR